MEQEDKPVVVLGPLDGPDGNAYAILNRAKSALRAYGRTDDWEAIRDEMTSGDYEHLLDVLEKHFTVMGTAVVPVDNWRDRR